MQLTHTQITAVVKQTRKNGEMLSMAIMRAGGDRDDYLKAYDLYTFGYWEIRN